MKHRALACDYDGTLAEGGVVEKETLDALSRWIASGGILILVTGRELGDLGRSFPKLDLFDRIVAENGAVLYRPAEAESRVLAEPPSADFLNHLMQQGIRPLSVGRVIVSTVQPHEAAVLESIRKMGLELQIVFNKGAVMVLPSGINKATGLKAALAELNLSRQDVAGIGDAENDHVFLSLCGLSVAVADALPALKERADLVTQSSNGAGVVELIGMLLADEGLSG